MHEEPIVAIATAPGRGAVGIVRLSGPSLAAMAETLCGRVLRPREASYVCFRDSQGDPIDYGLAIYFPAPHSFTGEDVLELQAHGGPTVLQLLVRRCLELASGPASNGPDPLLPGLRLAQPGEFTRRAFLNDKIDLAQAESVADLIDASTEVAARSAARSLSGAFSDKIRTLLEALTQLRMLVEATLDFPEEEIDYLEQANARGQLDAILEQLDTLRAQASRGALLREGVRVVIAGQPNAGKSSLLNALAGAELAIVTAVPGTTRDKIEQLIQIEGVPVHVIDTAGLRETGEEVERIGVQRAWDAIGAADVVLFVHDLARAGDALYLAAEARIAKEIEAAAAARVPVINVWNKVDLAGADSNPAHAQRLFERSSQSVILSAKTGTGMDALRRTLLQAAGWQGTAEGVFMARDRHLEALAEVAICLQQAAELIAEDEMPIELFAEELRQAQRALGGITGEFTADDLLGAIFSRFCIGK